MAEINWDDVYKNYLTQTKSTEFPNGNPFKAAEYTVFGRLTGSKKIPTTYTQEEWYQYEAPDYWRATQYKGDDLLASYTRDSLAKAKSFDELIGVARGANSGTNYLLTADYGVVDYYADLKELWKQRTSAEKKASSSSSKWWTQYGLPDPNQKFDSLENYAKTGSGNVFSAGKKYIIDATAKYKANLIKKGVSETDATARAKDYAVGIGRAIDKKLDDAGVSPFLIAAQQRIRARG